MNSDELISMVSSEKYKVVCFGLSDILLLPTMGAGSMYRLAEKSLGVSGLARSAELCIARAEKNGRKLSSAELYRQISSEQTVPNFSAEKALAEERRLYLQLSSARRSMKKVWNAARKAGKIVCAAEDALISGELAQELLTKNGFSECGGIFLSSELGCDIDGLLSHAVEKYSCVCSSEKQVLYLGHRREAGLTDRVYIPLPSERLKSHPVIGKEFERCFFGTDNEYLAAFAANSVFDDPFCECRADVWFGKLVFAPWLICSVKRLLNDCEKRGITDVVYLNTSGYLAETIHGLMKAYCGNISLIRMDISEEKLNSLFSEKKGGLFDSLHEFPLSRDMTAEEFIKYRLLTDEDNDDFNAALGVFKKNGFGRRSKLNKDEFTMLAPELSGFFEKNGTARARETAEYVHSILGSVKKCAVFETGCRMDICGLLRERFEIEADGYFLFDHNRNRSRYAFAPVKAGASDLYRAGIIKPLTEDLLKYSAANAPREENDTNEAQLIQDLCVEMTEDILELFGDLFNMPKPDPTDYFELYLYALENCPPEYAELLSSIGAGSKEHGAAYSEWRNNIVSGKKRTVDDLAVNGPAQCPGSKEKVYSYLRRYGISAPIILAQKIVRKLWKKLR